VHRRLIKIWNDKVYYTPENFISLSETNFPESAGFSDLAEIFWEVELFEFDKEEKVLNVNILNYKPENTFQFENQRSKDKINSIQFKHLDLDILRPFLNRYNPLEFDKFLDEDATTQQTLPETQEHEQVNHHSPSLNSQKPAPISFQESFKYYFKNAKFNLGFLEVRKKFYFLNEPFTFKIYNSEILPEFNYIKSFFPKVFKGKKQFSVQVWIEMENDEIIKTKATSPEINQINEALIDSIKQLRTLRVASALTPDIDKSLFTPDEIFSQNEDDGIDGNIFKQDGQDILNAFLTQKDIRNKKQLEYIAGYKHSPRQKIRFTLRPLFGFLFFVEGETMNHFCWELLNSHATYLWSFDKTKNLDNQLFRVESSINLIRDMGRQKYKNAYRNNLLDTDVHLTVIPHRYANSPMKDSFVYWKQRFKECLV
jgi:hypothetical protein